MKKHYECDVRCLVCERWCKLLKKGRRSPGNAVWQHKWRELSRGGQGEAGRRVKENIDLGLIISGDLRIVGLVCGSSFTTCTECKAGPDREDVGVKNVQGVKSWVMHVGGCHVITTTGFAPNVIFVEKKGIDLLLVHLERYIYTLLTADYPQPGSQGGCWGQSQSSLRTVKVTQKSDQALKYSEKLPHVISKTDITVHICM